MTLVESVLRATAPPGASSDAAAVDVAAAPPVAADVFTEVLKENDEPEVTDDASLVQVDVPEPDFATLEGQLSTSFEFPTAMKAKTLYAMQTLIDDYVHRTLDRALDDAALTPHSRAGVEPVFHELRKTTVSLVMDFLDERLVQDRQSYLEMKHMMVKELHTTREAAHLYLRRVREASFEKKRASVAVIRQQYREKLGREKDAIAGHMQGLKDAYAALWTLHSTCKDDINRLETTVRGLEGQVKYMTEDHKRQIKQINDENQEKMDIMRNEYLFGMKARGGTLYAEEDDDACDDDAAAGDGSGDAPAHATCEACEPLQKRIRELEAEVRLAASVYSMKNAPAPAGAADRGLGLKLNAIDDDDDDDDDDDASVMTGMSTARGGKKKKKKRKKGKGKGGKGKTPSKGRGAPLGTGRRGSGVPLPKSLASGRGSPMSRHNSSDALSTARSEVSDASEGDAGSHADGARHKRSSSSNSNSRNASRKASIRASFNTISSGMSDTSEDLDLSSLKGGKNVRRLMRGTVGGDDDLDASEAIATVMQHLRLDPNRVAELARVLESGGVGGQATDRRLQVLTDHAASQTQDSVDELLRTYLDAAKEATAMYVEASTNLKQQVARVAALEGERAELSKRLGVVETRLRQSADLHDLQLKERNLLLAELTDQLTVARKKLLKEQKVREHIAKSTAPVRLLDRAPPPSRREMLMKTLKLDPATLDEPVPATGAFMTEEAHGGWDFVGTGQGQGPGPLAGDGAGRRVHVGVRPATAGALRSNASASTTLLGLSHGHGHGHGDVGYGYGPRGHGDSSRDASPDPLGSALPVRRPSTSDGTSVSHSFNLRHELHRGFRAVHADPRDLPPTEDAYDSHVLAKQARITDDAGHRSILLTNQDAKDVQQVLAAINRDPAAQVSEARMGELKEVRKHIVTILADKVASGASGTLLKKKPTARPATAKAREESERGRALPMLTKK